MKNQKVFKIKFKIKFHVIIFIFSQYCSTISHAAKTSLPFHTTTWPRLWYYIICKGWRIIVATVKIMVGAYWLTRLYKHIYKTNIQTQGDMCKYICILCFTARFLTFQTERHGPYLILANLFAKNKYNNNKSETISFFLYEFHGVCYDTTGQQIFTLVQRIQRARWSFAFNDYCR